MTNNLNLEWPDTPFATTAPLSPQHESGVPRPEVAANAMKCALRMIWLPSVTTSDYASNRLGRLNERMKLVMTKVAADPADDSESSTWLRENLAYLRAELASLNGFQSALTRTVHVRFENRGMMPRVLAIAEDLLAAVEYCFDDVSLSNYLNAFQNTTVLRLGELWNIAPALKLVLLEHIIELAAAMPVQSARRLSIAPSLPRSEAVDELRAAREMKNSIQSLREIQEAPWQELLEPLMVFDRVLREDPARAYSRMDRESRERYRAKVAKLANYSDCSELEIAEIALALAKRAPDERTCDPRLALRRSHVGYYLVAEGREVLYRRANVRLPFHDRAQEFLRRHPDDFYPLGIESITACLILLFLWWVNFSSPWEALFCALALLIPASQSAVEIMNYLTTTLLEPEPLPKLDFAAGIPEECTTMVVVPTLLLNEKQVRQLVKELEVRYVGNMSANLHVALLTDLPDSTEQPREDDPLVELCGRLIRELNGKYAGSGAGRFAMFHRHRVFNRSEGVWMGWERKRGKLHDFNQLILGIHDSFPYKVCDLSVVRRIRYVLTLDSDTELPRDSARKLIGTMAHPLCQAIIDLQKNIVTEGYGILQPRVGVSVQSAAQSRLASIYSGRTGVDIYTRATSDVYQDLNGEGTFVGKGLYEVRTMHQVLNSRFPRNAILSHDLIEGAYARAGLVSDVEVIDRYPSHHSAYVRRKHRWVRGDWQIWEWLFPRVPDESGRRVRNPISLISRWKILDNLRRSMVEPAVLALFLLGWALLPGRPLYWTLVALGIVFLPAAFQFGVGMVRAAWAHNLHAVSDVCASLATGVAGVLLGIVFLLHDALVATDAIWRSLYRHAVSRRRMLEWETAAQAEGDNKRTQLDLYLLLTPVAAFIIGITMASIRPSALWVAVSILVLWASSKPISLWLAHPPRNEPKPPSRAEALFLRRSALRTWHYFAELSNQEHHWLVPDYLREEPPQVAAKVSPTNLGLLLNARQVACELGYLTVPELVEQTRRTLETMNSLPSHKGHLLNWYDTRTLAPLGPWFISSVDSGNLAASLLTLNHGCRSLIERPLLSPSLLDGYDDCARELARLKGPRLLRQLGSYHRRNERGAALSSAQFKERLTKIVATPVQMANLEPYGIEAQWYLRELRARAQAIAQLLADYTPWLLPEFEDLLAPLKLGAEGFGVQVSLAELPDFIQRIESGLRDNAVCASERGRTQCCRLLAMLKDAHVRAYALLLDLDAIANEAERWFARMDFSFLLNSRRKLLSIGYDVDAGKLHSACYDLLASEARIATFIAIAKGDVPQEVWFSLGRTTVATTGGAALASWTGTMFEYLMPALWMTSYPDTLLQDSMLAAVTEQRAYVAEKGIPWGISESGYSELDAAGNYGYRAFGDPRLALQCEEHERVVIAPYATALALSVAPHDVVQNLRQMEKIGWFGNFGFYEAGDFGPVEQFRRGSWRLVRSWMAHHQGMSLLSISNFLLGNVVQHWFHEDVRVQATELLLQERAVHREPEITPKKGIAAESRASAEVGRTLAPERKVA